MNADRRIIPTKYILSLLAEDHITERTHELSLRLNHSSHRLYHVANTWLLCDGINVLSRIILKYVDMVPRDHISHHVAPEIHISPGFHDETIVHHNHSQKEKSELNIIIKILGEIFKFFFKLITVLILFGPTRTFIVLLFGSILINSFMELSLPSFILACIGLSVHLISTGFHKISGSHEKTYTDHMSGSHGHH